MTYTKVEFLCVQIVITRVAERATEACSLCKKKRRRSIKVASKSMHTGQVWTSMGTSIAKNKPM